MQIDNFMRTSMKGKNTVLLKLGLYRYTASERRIEEKARDAPGVCGTDAVVAISRVTPDIFASMLFCGVVNPARTVKVRSGSRCAG